MRFKIFKILLSFLLIVDALTLKSVELRCDFSPKNSGNKAEDCNFFRAITNLTERSKISSVTWTDSQDYDSHLTTGLLVLQKIFHYFPENLNEKFTNLQRIDIRYSGLKEIKQKDIARITYLKELDLSGNKLTEIEIGLFDKNIYLEKIFLNYNEIKFVDVSTLRSLRSLSTFNFNNNKCLVAPALFNDRNDKGKVLDQIEEKCSHPVTTTEKPTTKSSTAITQKTTTTTTLNPYEIIFNQKIKEFNHKVDQKLNENEWKHGNETQKLQSEISKLKITIEGLKNQTEAQKLIQQGREDNEGNQNNEIAKHDSKIQEVSKNLSLHKDETNEAMTELKNNLSKNFLKKDNLKESVELILNPKLETLTVELEKVNKTLTESFNANIVKLNEDLKVMNGSAMNFMFDTQNKTSQKVNALNDSIIKSYNEAQMEIILVKNEVQRIDDKSSEANSKIGELNDFYQSLEEKKNDTSEARINSPEALTAGDKTQWLIMTNLILIAVILIFMIYSFLKCIFKRQHPRVIESAYELPKLKPNLTMTTLNEQCEMNHENIYNSASLTYGALSDSGYDKVKFDEVYEELPNESEMIVNYTIMHDDVLSGVGYDEIALDGNLQTEYEEIGFNIESCEDPKKEENLPVYAVVNKNR